MCPTRKPWAFTFIDASEDGPPLMKIPYAPHLVGNPETGVVHGGVVTTLLDHASGLAVMCALEGFASTATLDLRIDYHAPATPETGHFWPCLLLQAYQKHRFCSRHGLSRQSRRPHCSICGRIHVGCQPCTKRVPNGGAPDDTKIPKEKMLPRKHYKTASRTFRMLTFLASASRGGGNELTTVSAFRSTS